MTFGHANPGAQAPQYQKPSFGRVSFFCPKLTTFKGSVSFSSTFPMAAVSSLTIIVPCYNERATIASVLSSLIALDLGQTKKEIIVVDDGSTDGSALIIDQYKSSCVVIHLPKNSGKGRAVSEAMKRSTGEYVIVHDADLELDPVDIPKMIEKAQKTDQPIFGSRALRSDKPKGWNPFYLWGGFGMTALVNFLFGLKLTDVSCSYKLLRRDVLDSLKLKEEGFSHEVELAASLALRGYSPVEQFVQYTPRAHGAGKKLRTRDGISIAKTAFSLFWRGRREGTIRRLIARYSHELILIAVSFAACFTVLSLLINANAGSSFPPESAFFSLAKNVVEHGVYADDDKGAPALYPHSSYTPLYPLLIAPFVGFPVGILILNWFFRAVLVVMTYRLAKKIGSSQTFSFWGAFLFALEPYHLVITNYVTPETVFTVFIVGYVFALLRYIKKPTTTAVVVSSLFLGFSTLTRPVSQFFFPLHLVVIAVIERKSLKRGLWHGFLFALVTVVVLAPWLIRNHRLYGAWSLSSLPSIQLLNAAMPHFFEWKEGSTKAREQAIFDRTVDLKEKAGALIGYNIQNRFSLDLRESKPVMREIVAPFLKEYGVEFFYFYLTQFPFQLVTDNWRTALENMTHWPQKNQTTLAAALSAARGDPTDLIDSIKTADAYLVAFIGGKLYWGFFYLLSFVGFVALVSRRDFRFSALLCVFLVCYFPFLSLPYLESRYRLPGTPFVVVLAAFGLTFLFAKQLSPLRTGLQKVKDFIFFPLRAVTMFEKDRFGLSSLASERFDYVARELRGRCLDIGCGKWNRFINEYAHGNGVGIDVFKYEGLTNADIVSDMTKLPYINGSFDTVTFIADINHVPKSKRDAELAEAYRVLRFGGNIVITMGNPVAELLVHKLVYWYDRLLGTSVDMDTERGMDEEEEYYLLNREIKARLKRAGFKNIRITYFATQWGLNHLFVAEKE